MYKDILLCLDDAFIWNIKHTLEMIIWCVQVMVVIYIFLDKEIQEIDIIELLVLIITYTYDNHFPLTIVEDIIYVGQVLSEAHVFWKPIESTFFRCTFYYFIQI